MNDPNALPPEPDDQEPVAPPEPQAPTVDVDTAYRVIADAEGWDPRLTRFEMQELKRKKEDFEREKREFQERTRPPETPTPDFGGDQYAQMLYENKRETAELKRILLDREKKERDKEEQETLIQTLGADLDSAYKNASRQAGMTREQMDKEEKAFFDMLTQIYPDPKMIERLGPDQAVRNTFRLFRGGNGAAPTTRSPYRDPRAMFTIPSGSTSGPIGDDGGPRRPNESQEEYVARLKRVLDEAGGKLSTLPERATINPG